MAMDIIIIITHQIPLPHAHIQPGFFRIHLPSIIFFLSCSKSQKKKKLKKSNRSNGNVGHLCAMRQNRWALFWNWSHRISLTIMVGDFTTTIKWLFLPRILPCHQHRQTDQLHRVCLAYFIRSMALPTKPKWWFIFPHATTKEEEKKLVTQHIGTWLYHRTLRDFVIWNRVERWTTSDRYANFEISNWNGICRWSFGDTNILEQR